MLRSWSRIGEGKYVESLEMGGKEMNGEDEESKSIEGGVRMANVRGN